VDWLSGPVIGITLSYHLAMNESFSLDRFWRASRSDLTPIALIMLLPIILALPQLVGWLDSDPLAAFGGLAKQLGPQIVRGIPYIDPNSGYTTQALGYRAALEWLAGNVPWWNAYSGVGLPLAAEYQPAAFFPLTLALLLPHGMVWEHCFLQILAGWGTYGLLRQMELRRLAATTGGLLFAFNGTLAWFSHAPALVVPFLPWALWGVERARLTAASGFGKGWRLFAVAMAMSLLGGFPETAYIHGLLILAWAILRAIQLDPDRRAAFAGRIILGGAVGIAVAAPQLLAFFEYLPGAEIGGHTAEFAYAALNPETVLPTLVMPYAFGPIMAYPAHWQPLLSNMWGGMGGYVGIALLVMAIYGFSVRRNGLTWLLLIWCILCLTKTYRLEPGLTLLNAIPGVAVAAFCRYAYSSWEFALIVVAMFGLDHLSTQGRATPWAERVTGLILLGSLAGILYYWAHLWPIFESAPRGFRNWGMFALFWAVFSSLLCFFLICRARSRSRVALAAFLVFDSVLMFAIPTLSAPRSAVIDQEAIAFLQNNLGLQRFFTLGPIQANYGAYFGIASINHNYLPVSGRWTQWARSHLDAAADPIVFNGNFSRGADQPSQTAELRRNQAAYEWVGVKYVVSSAHENPFQDIPPASADSKSVKQVYADEIMRIYELPEVKSYFEDLDGNCRLEALGRLHVLANCTQPATLLRRELYFPGWTATVNGSDQAIGEYGQLFQSVALPQGRSDVEFRYAPPNVGWAWGLTGLGLIALAAVGFVPVSSRRRMP